MHKYNFCGEIRTYKKQLTLIDESVIYMGITDEVINHWDKQKQFYPHTNVIPADYTVEQFLEDTKRYASAKLHESQITHKPKKKGEKKPLYSYMVNGLMRYYEVEKPLSLFNTFSKKKNIEYMGIVYDLPAKKKTSIEIKTQKTGLPIKKNVKPGDFICCYCECSLTAENYTKEHLVPRNRGGKDTKLNLRPCCEPCNSEKGSLMLHSYIQLLNMRLLDFSGDELDRLQIKIRNANRIAKEINQI